MLFANLAVAVRKVRSITTETTGFVGKIFKGEKPNELSVVRSTKFELLINLTVLGSCSAQEVARLSGYFAQTGDAAEARASRHS